MSQGFLALHLLSTVSLLQVGAWEKGSSWSHVCSVTSPVLGYEDRVTCLQFGGAWDTMVGPQGTTEQQNEVGHVPTLPTRVEGSQSLGRGPL